MDIGLRSYRRAGRRGASRTVYTQEDIARAKKKWNGYLLMMGAVALVLLAGVLAGLLVRLEWLAYAAAVLLVIALVSSWGLQGVYHKRYNKHLSSLQTSLHHDMDVVFAARGDAIAFRDGLPYYPFSVKEGEGEKAWVIDLYFDAYRLFPDWKTGDKIRLTLVGAMVIGWEEGK